MILNVAGLVMGTARIQRLTPKSRVESSMPNSRSVFRWLVVVSAAFAGAMNGPPNSAAGQQSGATGSSNPAATQLLFALANQARVANGVAPLKWDSALAAGALDHCQRMVYEGPIAHRYGGEPDLQVRAQSSGAHFSLVAENVALGSHIATIHQGWLDSPGHRANLLNPQVDSVGIAVVSSGGILYAVADYARSVPMLTYEQVEASVGALIRPSGLLIERDPGAARAYCATGSRDTSRSSFLVVWENPDVSALPAHLASRLASGMYHSVAVGACAPQRSEPGFTSYRVAVILH